MRGKKIKEEGKLRTEEMKYELKGRSLAFIG
jgi:hypothetical protein